METIYNFSVKDAELTDISLKKYENKIILIVNVASFCGLTYQYKGLENIYKKYKDEGFEIIGFPCNQFAFQEPGSNQEIKEFCDTNYGVTFEIMSKIKVNGPKADPLFKFLKKQKSGIAGTPQIKWNFTKFLINRDGEVIKRFGPKIEAKDIESTIQKIL